MIQEHYIKAKESFNWDEMAYALFCGLLPTLWDTISDLHHGFVLEREGKVYQAGLCFFFLTNPGVFVIWRRIHGILPGALEVFIIIIIGHFYVFMVYYMPGYSKYLGLMTSTVFIIVKIIAVFDHSPEIKAISRELSESEFVYESSLQLGTLLLTWLHTGKLYSLTIASSLFFISKVAAENLVSLAQEEDVKPSFIRRVKNTFKYIPMLMLTVLFRIGCLVLYTFPPTLLTPFSILSSFLVLDVFYVFRLMISWVCITPLMFVFVDLNQMSNFEKLTALNGDLITLNHWPKV